MKRPIIYANLYGQAERRHSAEMRMSPSLRYGITAWVLLMSALVPARAQYVGHPPLPDEKLYIHCGMREAGAPVTISDVVAIPSPAQPAELDQSITLSDPLPPIRLKKYLPRALLEQDVLPAEDASAPPAVRLSVIGPTQAHRLWLVAGDMERNRLVSTIGTWRYMAVEDTDQRDALFAQFEVEQTRPPLLIISKPGSEERFELIARPGESLRPDQWGYEFKVIQYFPHFGIDNTTKSPVNRSDEHKNPAAQVEISGKGAQELMWVFSRFPDFKRDQSKEMPFRLLLDAPVAGEERMPDYALVTVGLQRHEVWRRFHQECTSSPCAVGEKVNVPGRDFTFSVEQFVPRGRLVESYVASELKGAVPALLLETADGSGAAVAVWLELGKKRIIPTKLGPLSLTITLGPALANGAHP